MVPKEIGNGACKRVLQTLHFQVFPFGRKASLQSSTVLSTLLWGLMSE